MIRLINVSAAHDLFIAIVSAGCETPDSFDDNFPTLSKITAEMLRFQELLSVATVLLALSPQPAFSAAAQCFFPDGFTTTPDVPCNQSAIDAGGHSPCCNEYVSTRP